MAGLEALIIDILLHVFTHEQINAFLTDTPRNAAIITGVLIAISGALLGTFLLLRGMALTSDAISHTVLLGIVVAFIIMTSLLGQEPDLSSPWLIIGAAAAGVATVVLTEVIYSSGLVKQDAALGLAFPLLFAVAVILVARYVDDAHIDEDAVMVGEIGLASSNTNQYCFENCSTVVIDEDDPRAELVERCVNCRELGLDVRSARNDDRAEFREVCTNCGTYSPGRARAEGLLDGEVVQVSWPESITVTAIMALLTLGFVTLFYKELKLASFDAALAKALGFRPGVLHYALMVMVSLVAVGAFDAVGSILVIAFFIIPSAAAYLLTDRLALMLVLSAMIGGVGTYLGYDLAQGTFLGFIQMDDVLVSINRLLGTDLSETWEASISASMVLMIFFLFLLAWVLSPKSGLVSTLMRRANQRRRFDNQVVLGHIYNHQHTDDATQELTAHSLHQHFQWSRRKMARVLVRLRAANLIHVRDGMVLLTANGEERLRTFRTRHLAVGD